MHGTFPHKNWTPPKEEPFRIGIGAMAALALIFIALLGLMLWGALALVQLAFDLDGWWALKWTLLSALLWAAPLAWWTTMIALAVESEEQHPIHRVGQRESS